MSVLLLFAFLAGLVTILAPCIWPLLPIVLSASSGSGRRRPLGITLGVMTSFTIFTLSISYLEKFLHLDPNAFRLIAVVIIGLLGLSMIIPALSTAFENGIQRLLSPFQKKVQKQGNGLAAGYWTGFSIGLVWAPCAGPILATIATLAATQAVDVRVILVTLAYVIGVGIPLFFVTLAGSVVFARMRTINKFTGRIQQVFGVIMIAAALLIYTNYDKAIQVKILNAFPSYGKFLEGIEHNATVTRELSHLRGEEAAVKSDAVTGEALPDLGPAVEIAGIDHWLNSSPLTLAQLRGKVVLIDFWTYSCINCVRTLPHVTGWYERYKDLGFVVIGVHTPEFAFEKETRNVEAALKQFKINYPVAQDNHFATWKAYKNQYWPAEYLIDADGRLRRTHFGEGGYDETEMAIRQLLQETGKSVQPEFASLKDATPKIRRTPETYLGSLRAARFASPEKLTVGEGNYTLPADLPLDHFALEGRWVISPESAASVEHSALVLHFQGERVFLVLGSKEQGTVKVFLDDAPVAAGQAGADIKDAGVTVDRERLYHLIDLRGHLGAHRLRLEFQQGGISAYAFTFG